MPPARSAGAASKLCSVSPLAILRLVTEGAANAEIGPSVHLSAAAVKARIGRLMRRLGASRRAELSAQALRIGLA